MAPPEDRPTLRPTLYAIRDLPYEMGPYRLMRKLPEGMAEVYEAEDLETPRRVAVKFLRNDMLLTDEARERFLREIELAANLDHAGVVPVLRSGVHEGVPYYVMPFIEGARLDHYLKDSCPTLDGKLRVFRDLCRVVNALHARGWAHRDLKPGNILVDRYGTIRLLDFGLAKDTHALSTTDKQYTFLGTLGYMAPEQASGEAEKSDSAADVYTIGVLMYRELTGEMPHADDPKPEVMLRRLREEDTRPLRSFRRDLPPPIEILIEDCLRRDPGQRPPTAAAVEARLSTFLSRKPVPSPAPLFIIAALLIGSVIGYLLWPDSAKATDAPNDETPAIAADVATPTDTETEADQIISFIESNEATAQPEPALPLVDAISTPVPKELWPSLSALQSELRIDFSRRRQAAILLHLPHTSPHTVTVEVMDSKGVQSFELRPGQSTGVFVEADKPAIVNDGTQRLQVAVSPREATYLSL